MEINFNQKKSRALIIAENKKAQEIKHVLELRDEMIAHNIDKKLIKKYIDEQYEKINQIYEKKIKKHQENELNKQTKNMEKEIKIKRKKAIEFLLKNKTYLEEKKYNPDYIKKYVEKQYNEINQIYNISNIKNIDLDQIDFID
jgi:hypothetical protein